MSDIFMSYRRSDSEPESRRIFEWLTRRFGKGSVFMDLSSIGPGEDFRSTILQEIASAQTMLVIIGKQWWLSEDADGRQRLDDPHDLVRQEIVTALQRGVRVVPVLVSDALIPQADQLPDALSRLTKLNALRVRVSFFEADMIHLAEYVDKWIIEHAQIGSTESPVDRGWSKKRFACWVFLALARQVLSPAL